MALCNERDDFPGMLPYPKMTGAGATQLQLSSPWFPVFSCGLDAAITAVLYDDNTSASTPMFAIHCQAFCAILRFIKLAL